MTEGAGNALASQLIAPLSVSCTRQAAQVASAFAHAISRKRVRKRATAWLCN